MVRFIIQGGNTLKGKITISGSKNAALPAMCAAILSDTPSTLTNVPDIRDVHALAEILRSIGATVNQKDNHTWEISGQGINKTEIEYLLGRRLRASILLLGPLLARKGSIKLPHPGGCIIGKRPIGSHFDALHGLGAIIDHEGDYYVGKTAGLRGAYLYLDEVSVTATENAVMAASLAKGKTTIRPAALEPHVVNLCQMLTAMGAKIEGAGTHTIIVEGVESLNGSKHRIVSDEIETGTFAVAAAVTGGELVLENTPLDLDPIIYKLRAMGVDVAQENDVLTVRSSGKLVGDKIQVDTWPRFPTDLQPQFGVLATQAEGETYIHEWMYENRLKYTESLAKMGAEVQNLSPHQAIITGPTKLHSATIDSPDLRSGISYVLAALCAEGKSVVNYGELILRGYENIVQRLRNVGADIEQEEVEDPEEKK